MANDESYNWLQGSWTNGRSEESNVQSAQQNSTPHEHPPFADAERVARAAHEAFLRSQSEQQMRSGQSNGQHQQHGINRVMSQSPTGYQSPYFQGRQQSHEQRGFQQHQRPQAPQMPQPQYVRPSDLNSSRSPYQVNATRQAYGPAATAGLSQSSVPAEMTASRSTLTPQRTPSTTLDSRSRMALLEYLQRSGATITSQASDRQSRSMQQAARVATSSPKQSVPAPTPQAAHQTRTESRSQTPAQASSTSSPVLDNRNANMDVGRYGAALPRNDPSTAASHSAMVPRAHGSNSPAARAQPMSPKGPAVSSSQSPRPTTATPASSAPPATHVSSAPSARVPVQTSQGDASMRHSPASASSGPYKPPVPQRFLPHSSLHAPPQPNQPTGRSQPPTPVVYQSPYTSNQSSTPSGAQSTHNGRAAGSAGPSSNTAQASRAPVSQQQRAAGTAAAAVRTTQSHLSLPAHVENGDPLRDTRSPNWRMSSGLPLPPSTVGPASAPMNAQQHPNLSNAPKTTYQSGHQMVQQAAMHANGHGQGQPPTKIRRMQDGTKHAVMPSAASNNRKHVSPYASRAPGMVSQIQKAPLVQPFDPREAALKDAYDPTTIARDILINANKHPTEKPLNHHLEILRTSFTAVTFLSDLSTFRWDLVDPDPGPRDSTVHRPGPPTRPEARPVYQQYQQPTGPSVLGSLPFKSPAYHPRSAPAPAPQPTPTPAPGPTFAPTIAHPITYPPRSAAGPHVGPITQPPAPQPAPRPPPVIDLTSKPAQAPSVAVSQPVTTPAPAHAPTPTPAPSTTAALAHPATPSRTVPVSQSPRPKPTPAQKSPTKSLSKPPSQSPRSKTYPQPQVVISTSPETMPPQKRKSGRPKRTPGNKVEVAIHNEPNVPFPVFHCKWTNCQSELHNIRALQNHVLKGHIPNDINCGWEGCTDKTPRAANNMWTHVRENHIEPMAWALGDGPSVPAPGEDFELALDTLS